MSRAGSSLTSSGFPGGSSSRKAPGQGPTCYFATLHDDLVVSIVTCLDAQGLLTLQQCDRRLQRLAANESHWAALFVERFGAPSSITAAAHTLAGSYQALYRSKTLTDREAGKWRKPCPFELQAALQAMITSSTTTTKGANGSSTTTTSKSSTRDPTADPEADEPLPPDGDAAGGAASPSEPLPAVLTDDSDESEEGVGGATDDSSLSRTDSQNSAAANNANEEAGQTRLAVVFLIDSSGSVGDEDFSEMCSFLDKAADAVAAAPNCKVCVVQFSNDTRVEVPLGALDKAAFDTAIHSMVRLNGGTNIAAAVAKAGALLKADDVAAAPDMRRVLVLLTDGRIDGYQAREAASMVARLADEQSNVALWAFGVGRGVDAAELMRIIEGPGEACKGLGAERYMDLCVRDDAPW